MTAFGVGGPAQAYLKLASASDFDSLLGKSQPPRLDWVLGSATNVLISDAGLEGLTLHLAGGRLLYDETAGLLVADSGASWDELVRFAVERGLWGVELMSGIPGTVGGAAAININAYGQSLSDTLAWVESYDPETGRVSRDSFDPREWTYKRSPFAGGKRLILRIALRLERQATGELTYAAALAYARERGLSSRTLSGRRQIILGTRAGAGSLLDGSAKTCGSFFKNPAVDKRKVEALIAYEETNLTAQSLLAQSRLQDGDSWRVSAAHVLLAAGFRRGQRFGRVRLHPDHVLKVENYAGASAQEIYDTALTIRKTVKMKLDIDLEFEVQTMGPFADNSSDKPQADS